MRRRLLNLGLAAGIVWALLTPQLAVVAQAATTDFRQQILPMHCIFQIIDSGTGTLRYLTPVTCGQIVPPANPGSSAGGTTQNNSSSQAGTNGSASSAASTKTNRSSTNGVVGQLVPNGLGNSQTGDIYNLDLVPSFKDGKGYTGSVSSGQVYYYHVVDPTVTNGQRLVYVRILSVKDNTVVLNVDSDNSISLHPGQTYLLDTVSGGMVKLKIYVQEIANGKAVVHFSYILTADQTPNVTSPLASHMALFMLGLAALVIGFIYSQYLILLFRHRRRERGELPPDEQPRK